MTASRATTQPPEVVDRRVELALHMLELGAWVFPLASNAKIPFLARSKGGQGFIDAKPDPAMARTFLTNPGQLNYGVVFPEGSDVIVLDLDGGDRSSRPSWRADWQALYDRLGPPGLTYTVRTPSDGRHAYYRWRTDLYGPLPPGDELLGWTVRKPWKGYVVGPGSVVAGKTYEPTGADHIADLPEAWSRAALAEKAGKRQPPAADPDVITIKGPGLVQAGHRHGYLRDQARHMVGLGLTGDALFTAVMDLNRQLPEPKTENEVRRAIGDAETKFEPDPVVVDEATGEVVRTSRPTRLERVYAEDVELALPAVQAFPADPDPIAFEGLAGDAIRSLKPLTSASEVGMLVTLLAAWGGVYGTTTTYHGEQPSVLFGVLIGETGRARKGTTTSAVWNALTYALTSSMAIPLSSARWDGMASGEALIRILAEAKGSDPHKPVHGLIVEEEFERLLKRMRSSDTYQSTLDVYLRAAFDGRALQHITAAKSLRVLPPYGVSILGNVTRETLRQNVTPDMARSGFANRFLWTPIREREVSVSGSDPWRFTRELDLELQVARDTWSGIRELAADKPAIDLLNDYGRHLRSLLGLSGAMSARLHVIAARVALVHASIDRAASVDLSRVDRAIALTEYARAGLTWSFRDDVGDDDANVLYSACLAAVPQGLSTRQAQAVIGRSGRFMKARDLLIEAGLITVTNRATNSTQTVTNPDGRQSGGRPAKILQVVDQQAFEGFVPRARARGLGEADQQSDDSLSTNPHKPSTNYEQTVYEPSRTSEPSQPGLTVEAASSETIACHFFTEHQTRHVRVAGRWVCPICDPTPSATEPVA